MKAAELVHRFTDGRRCQGTCLLSKKQSAWLADVVRAEIRREIPAGESDDPIVVGEFSLRRVGRGFSRNGNGGVIHVAHMAECREAQTEADARAAADRERRFGGVETPAAMVPPKQERAMKVQDLIFVLKAVDAAFGVLSAHPAFAGDADEAPEFNEGGVGYQATEMVREALEGQEPEVLRKYRALHDGLSEMVEEGRLTRDMIPDDYHWLVETLAELAVLDPVGKE